MEERREKKRKKNKTEMGCKCKRTYPLPTDTQTHSEHRTVQRLTLAPPTEMPLSENLRDANPQYLRSN